MLARRKPGKHTDVKIFNCLSMLSSGNIADKTPLSDRRRVVYTGGDGEVVL